MLIGGVPICVGVIIALWWVDLSGRRSRPCIRITYGPDHSDYMYF